MRSAAPLLLALAALALGGWWFARGGAGEDPLAPGEGAAPQDPGGATGLVDPGALTERAPPAASGAAAQSGPALVWPGLVVGRVRDSFGDPRRAHLVGFVPEGERAPTRPAEWLALPHARTARDGSFTARLPAPGRYRLFVGFGGRVTFEGEAPVELGPGGPGQVDVVMRAPTRLLIEVHDAPGAPTAPPYGVTVYRDAALLDRERPLPPQTTTDALPDLDDPALDEDTRAELRVAVEHQSRELTAEERAAMQRRLRVVPPGWRMDRSAVLDAQNRLLLEFLPAGEELRFAASAGGEAFRVEGSAWLDAGAPTRVRIDLPPPRPADEAASRDPRAARATITPVALARPPLEPGATWTR